MTPGGIIPSTGSRDDYPLVQADCQLVVVDVNVHATVSQTFISTSHKAQDVAYVFPVPSDAAVCYFCAVIDDERTIHGVVQERAQAQQRYDKAISEGKTAAMLQQHSSQVFETSLGNIKPGSTVRVIIKYVSIAAQEGSLDSLRLRMPVSVAPIYGTPKDIIKAYAAARKLKTNPFNFAASIQMPGKINSIVSSTCPLKVKLRALTSDSATDAGPNCAHVSISGKPSMFKSDIVLDIKCDDLDSPRYTIQRFNSSPQEATDQVTDAMSLTLVPCFRPIPVPSQEYIFLVDRSGSMTGVRIRAVRAAMQIMLRSLPTKGSWFNIFSFGEACDSLWPASRDYVKDTVDEASRYVEAMRADYGTTLIANALRKVAESRNDAPKVPTAVFVLTDGGAWDAQAAFRVVTQAVAESDNALRVFVLGVGKQVSTEMCEGIARAGRGVAAYVHEKEALDTKLIGLLKAARNAPVQDLTIDWGVIPLTADKDCLQQAPMQLDSLPPLYPGFRYSIFALIRRPRGSVNPAKAVVKGSTLGVSVALDVPVACVPALESGLNRVPFLHVLAARALVQNLEDNSAGTHGILDALTKEQIARLGTTYSIVTSQTSFVAIDEDGEALPCPVIKRKDTADSIVIDIGDDEIPTARGLTAGMPDSHGLVAGESHAPNVQPTVRLRGSVKPPSEPVPVVSEPRAATLTYVAPAQQVDGSLANLSISTLTLSPAPQPPPEPVPAPEPAPAANAAVTLATVALAQQFDGSFPNINTLKISSVPRPPHELAKSGDFKVLWNTVLAMAFLQASYGSPDERAAWEFMGDKARKFAIEALVRGMGLEEDKAGVMLDGWIAQAVKILTSPSPRPQWKIWKKKAVI